jgi:hypothetical protein
MAGFRMGLRVMPLRLLPAQLARVLDGWGVRLVFALSLPALSRSAARRLRFWFRTELAKRRNQIMVLRSELPGALAPLRSVEWQFWFVLAIATAVMALMQYSVPLWYGGSDHGDYYWYGRYLLGDRFMGNTIPPNWRTPGMGIFHILSGTVMFDTWKGFIALFAAFSVAIPVLYYLMVRPHSRNFALLAALVVILSMTPYVYATAAGSDQVYFFLHALLLCLCVGYFQHRWAGGSALLGVIVCVAAYASLVRPVGAVIFWIFIVLAVILRPRDWRRLASAAGIYIVLMMSWVLWDRAYGTNGGAGPGLTYPQPTELSTSAERRLAEAYFSPAGLVHAESDNAAAGYPHSQRLRAVLLSFFAEHPHQWQESTLFTPQSLFARYAKDPQGAENLLDAFFTDRTSLYFAFIVRAVKDSLGTDAGLSLIHDVAAEHGTTGLYGIVRNFAIYPQQLFLGVTPNLAGRNVFGLLYRAKYREETLHIHSISQVPSPLLTPNLGPANRLIVKTVRRFIDDYPQYWPLEVRAKYRDNPENFYELIARDDTKIMQGYEGFLYQVLNWYLGPQPAGRAYGAAAREILDRYPKLMMLLYENFLNLTVARNIGAVAAPLDRAALDNMSDAYFDSRAQFGADLTSGLRKELVPIVTTNNVWKDVAALHVIVYLIAPVFVFLLIASFPFLRGSATTGPCLFLLLDYGYEVTSIAVFTPWGAPRYEANFYLLPFFICCMIFGQATARRGRKYHHPTELSRQPSASRTSA